MIAMKIARAQYLNPEIENFPLIQFKFPALGIFKKLEAKRASMGGKGDKKQRFLFVSFLNNSSMLMFLKSQMFLSSLSRKQEIVSTTTIASLPRKWTHAE